MQWKSEQLDFNILNLIADNADLRQVVLGLKPAASVIDRAPQVLANLADLNEAFWALHQVQWPTGSFMQSHCLITGSTSTMNTHCFRQRHRAKA